MHDAFMLGSAIVELKGRVRIALAQNDSGLRLASVWRAVFNKIAGLQTKAFPKSTDAKTLYEPPPKESLPYLYPPEPDYANLGIPGTDTSGVTMLGNFRLYEMTRRAINCLTLLYVKEAESLIPDLIKQYKDHLVKAILDAAKDPGAGGGDVRPLGDTSLPQDDLQKAKEVLTERTARFLEAWEGYLRENYYVGGRIPNDDAELIAYEAGHSISSLSWDISVATVRLELQARDTQAANEQSPAISENLVKAWRDVFRDQAVIRLQHQISALSSTLDDAFYLQHPDLKRQEGDAVLVKPNPDLPSQAIQAVKHSIDYWQRAVNWIASPENRETIRKPVASDTTSAFDPLFWTKMRLALTEQTNVWQTLMIGQQSLSAFDLESTMHNIMQDVTEQLQQSMRTDFRSGLQQAEMVMKEIADEAKEAIKLVGTTAIEGLESLFQSCQHIFWPIVAVIAVIFIALLIVAVVKPDSNAVGASGGFGVAGAISAILGYFGLGRLQQDKSERRTLIEAGQNTATDKVGNRTDSATTGLAGATAGDGNLLMRIEGAAHNVGEMVLKAFEQGYEQMRIELAGLSHSVAVAYPLVEFFVETFNVASNKDFLTKIIWSGTEREQEISQVLRAAFGPLALFITSPTSDSK